MLKLKAEPCLLCRDTTQLVYVPGSTITSPEIVGTVSLTPSTLYVLLMLGPEDVYADEYVPVQLAYAAHPEGSAGECCVWCCALDNSAASLPQR